MNREKIYASIKNPWTEKGGCTIYTLDGINKIFGSYASICNQDSIQSILVRMSNDELQIFSTLVKIFLDNETLKRIDQDNVSSLLVFLANATMQPSIMKKLELRVGIGLPCESISLRILAYLNYVVKIVQQLANIGFETYPSIVVYSAANMVLKEESESQQDTPQVVIDTNKMILDFLYEALPTNYQKQQLYVIQDKKIVSASTQEVIRILGERLFDVITSKNPARFGPIGATLQRKGKEISASNLEYTAAHALYSKDISIKGNEGLFYEDCDSDLVIMIGGPSETSYQFARKEIVTTMTNDNIPIIDAMPTVKVITRVEKTAPYRDERYPMNNWSPNVRKSYGTAKQELDTLFSLAPRAVDKVLSTNYMFSCSE